MSTIPRIVHRIWLDDPMPEAFAEYGRRWIEINPHWRLIDWTDPATLPRLANQDLFDRAAKIYPRDWKRFQADLLRLEILWIYGGVYADTDTEPRRPIDDLLAGRTCVVGRSPQFSDDGVHPITNAFMACIPQHPYLQALILRVPNAVRRYGHLSLARSVGPWHLTRTYERESFGDVTVLHHEDLYSGHWFIHHWNTRLRKRGRGLG